jgi:FemAB-related protein (PEP-CTERM system-associated)
VTIDARSGATAAPAVAGGGPVRVTACDATWGARWDTYLETAPGASLYHRWAWGDVNRDEFGHPTFALGALDGDRLVGVLPIVQVKTLLFGNIGCSMPFVNYGGPIADTPEVEAALLAAAADLARRQRMKYLELRTMRPLGDAYPALTHKVSMTVDLAPDPETLWTAFKSGHRQDIRKAEKEGFVARHGGRELLDDFYLVLSESWRNLGTPFYRKRYFERLFDALGSHFWITVIYAGTRPAAAQMSGFFRGTAEGLWLGMREEFRTRYVGYTLYWELLKYACQQGARTYHLGRSTSDSGAEAFKRKWNARATPLYWHYVVEPGQALPGLNVNNPKYRLAIDTWRKLPLGVTQIIGPHVARGIP